MNKSSASNQSLLLEIKRELKDVKNIVIDINKRNRLLYIELQKAKQEIVELNSRMPERKQGWFGSGYWEVKDTLSVNYENINNK